MTTDSLKISQLKMADIPDLLAVGTDLFDNPVIPDITRQFIECPRQHMLLARVNHQLVGMVSSFVYIHPDKQPHMFINELGVVEKWQNQGIAKQLIKAMLSLAKQLNISDAWLATEEDNLPARKVYVATEGKLSPDKIVMYEYDVN